MIDAASLPWGGGAVPIMIYVMWRTKKWNHPCSVYDTNEAGTARIRRVPSIYRSGYVPEQGWGGFFSAPTPPVACARGSGLGVDAATKTNNDVNNSST